MLLKDDVGGCQIMVVIGPADCGKKRGEDIQTIV